MVFFILFFFFSNVIGFVVCLICLECFFCEGVEGDSKIFIFCFKGYYCFVGIGKSLEKCLVGRYNL